MTHVRKRPTKTAIRHVADLVAAAFEERGAEIEGPVYRYDEDAESGERHVYDLGAVFTSAAGVMEYDLIVSASGVLVDEVEPDGPICDYMHYETAEFFEQAVPLLPDLRPTSIAIDLLALYRRHGAVVLDPKIDAELLHSDEDVLRACAMLELGAVASAWATTLWSMGSGARHKIN